MMYAVKPDGWLQRLGGPNAVSMPAWLLTLPGAVISAALTSRDPRYSDAWGWLVLGLGGHLVTGAVLFAAWLTVLRPVTRPSRPAVFFAVVFLAGAARGLFIAVAAYSWGLAENLNLAFRLTSATGTVLLWMSLATLIVDGSRRHKATMARLHGQIAQEQRLANASVQLVQEYRESIVSATKDTVAEQLQHAISLSAHPDEAAKHLRQIVDDVVRPLSHELEQRTVREDTILKDVVQGAEQTSTPVRSYFSSTFYARPFNPLLTVVLAAGTTIYINIVVNGPLWAICSTLIMSCTLAATSMWFRSTLATRLMDWRTAQRGVIVCCAWLCVAVVGAGVLVAVVLLAGSSTANFAAYQWVVTLLVCVAIFFLAQFAGALDGAVAHLRTSAERELTNAASALAWITARLRLQAYLEQRDLGRALHGAVQARIVSLALQLQLNPPEDAVAAIEDLSARVSASLDGGRDRPWRDAMREVQDLWSEAIALDMSTAHGAEAALDFDAVAAEAVVEVVREGITNAVRHGEADTVTVRISHTQGVIDVVLADDGHVSSPPGPPGMGARMLDAVCLNWSLTGNEGKTLRATITAAQQPQGGEVI